MRSESKLRKVIAKEGPPTIVTARFPHPPTCSAPVWMVLSLYSNTTQLTIGADNDNEVEKKSSKAHPLARTFDKKTKEKFAGGKRMIKPREE